MNSDMLSKLIAKLTPDSDLRKAFEQRPLAGTVRRTRQRKTRSGYTKNHSQPRNKARVRMARESRRRNRVR